MHADESALSDETAAPDYSAGVFGSSARLSDVRFSEGEQGLRVSELALGTGISNGWGRGADSSEAP